MKLKFLEKRLIRKVQNGDAEAFAKIYDEYIDKIYRFAYFRVNSPEEAEDLTSQIFTKVLEYILSGKEIINLQALIYTITKSQIADKYRHQIKEVSLDQSFAETVDISAKIELKDDSIKVEQVLKNLKGEAKEAIVLRYVEEHSIKEVAKILGKTEGAVRVMIHRAIKDIKTQMKDVVK